MPGLINQTNNVTLEVIESISNITNPADFFVKGSHLIYNGIFWFIMLWLLWIILFLVANKIKDHQPLQNAMYSGAVITVVAFIMRAVTTTIDGVTYAMINDHQLWIFPILTIVIATIVWATKDR